MGRNQDLFSNIRVYRLAFTVYWGMVLFGYDTGVAGGVVSQDYFKTHFGLVNEYGTLDTKKSDEVSSNVVSALQGGAFFGSLSSALVSARIGRKWTLILYTSIFMIGAVLTVLDSNPRSGLVFIYSGRAISGFGIGAISAVAPAFVSECSPKEVRGRITGLFQVMVAAGVMISYFVNFFVGMYLENSPNVWRIPFGCQLIPAGIMLVGLLTVKESPRWLASVGRREDAVKNLAYLRQAGETSNEVTCEIAEIEAAVDEERISGQRIGLRETFLSKGIGIRFIIAFVIFFLQQWAGQNSVNYYAPSIFTSIGYVGTKNSLLASGIYGVVKLLATALFVFTLVDSLGRKICLFASAIGMGSMFYILGAMLKMHPPSTGATAHPSHASKTMAAILYIYVCFYSLGWGPLPWVYVSEIFPMQTRHYGLSLASSSQWLWNFMVSKITPELITRLGYKIFFLFATINIAGNAVFSLLIPETKRRSLEEMGVIFGEEERQIPYQSDMDVDQVETPTVTSDPVHAQTTASRRRFSVGPKGGSNKG